MPLTWVSLFVATRLLIPAQSSPLDIGVRAMLRGDYSAAAAQLRALSAGPDADPAAEFLMAVLLSTGKGVDFNLGGACALFSETATSTHVLAQPAMELADTMRAEMGNGPMLLCTGGLPPEYVPAVFTLGPSHTVEITGSSIVVRFNGTETIVRTSLGPGMVALPSRYIALDGTRSAMGRRHFLLAFIWWRDPRDRSSSWSLGWTLAEIAGASYTPVAGGPHLIAAIGERPPGSVDLDSLVRVFLNAQGEVEWNAGTGDNLQRGIIPPRGAK